MSSYDTIRLWYVIPLGICIKTNAVAIRRKVLSSGFALPSASWFLSCKNGRVGLCDSLAFFNVRCTNVEQYFVQMKLSVYILIYIPLHKMLYILLDYEYWQSLKNAPPLLVQFPRMDPSRSQRQHLKLKRSVVQNYIILLITRQLDIIYCFQILKQSTVNI